MLISIHAAGAPTPEVVDPDCHHLAEAAAVILALAIDDAELRERDGGAAKEGPSAPGRREADVGAAGAVPSVTMIARATAAVPATTEAPVSSHIGAPHELADTPPPAVRGDAAASARPVATASAAAPAPDPSTSSTPARASSLQEEVALMREAERALATGNATGALDKLDQLSSRFENGVRRTVTAPADGVGRRRPLPQRRMLYV